LLRQTKSFKYICWRKAKFNGCTTTLISDKSKFSTLSDQLPLIIVIILVACLTAFIVSFCIVRKYCRRKYVVCGTQIFCNSRCGCKYLLWPNQRTSRITTQLRKNVAI